MNQKLSYIQKITPKVNKRICRNVVANKIIIYNAKHTYTTHTTQPKMMARKVKKIFTKFK